jgi:phosphatidylinositol 3-kinase
VTWEDANEVRQAVDLLPLWVEIDVDDALELLGPTFTNPSVQSHAVEQLKSADDEELLLYLLQLVQALKFGKSLPTSGIIPHTSPLAEFLISRSHYNPIFGNNFYWFLKVECEDKKYGKIYSEIMVHFMSSLQQVRRRVIF